MMLSPKLDCGRWTTRFQLTFPILALMLNLTLSVRAAAQSCPTQNFRGRFGLTARGTAPFQGNQNGGMA